LGTTLQKFEQFLRIDRLERTSDVIRARAVYMIIFTFVLSQIANLALMTYTYKQWTFDHMISVGVCIAMLSLTIGLRYMKKFALFALAFSLLLFVAIYLSSAFDYTGINSALLPFLIAGAVINGFVSGWRMVVAFCAATLVFVWYLYGLSTNAPTGALFDPALFEARNFQRAVQLTIAFVLISIVVGFASYHMHSAFFTLEEKITQVEEAAKDKSLFLANMSHELRTPLNGIMGFCDLLTKTSLNPQQAEYAKIVNKSSHTLLAIINDALDISKIDAGKLALSPQNFDLYAMIKSLINLYQPATIDKGLSIDMLYPDGFPRQYFGDQDKMRKVLNNLISNAVKFTETGSVQITVEKCYDITSDRNIKISVIDTGPGIAPKDHEVIFKKFAQLNNALNRNTEGTGLGLSLCQKIAAVMDGKIMLESELGAGSTFVLSVALPLATKTTPAASATMQVNEETMAPKNLDEPSIDEQDIDEQDIEFEIMVDDGDQEAA